MVYDLIIDGLPQAKERPRFAKGRVYTPQKTASYEKYVKFLFIQHYGKPVLSVALKVENTAFYLIPKSTSKKNRALMLNDDIKPTKKPDLDNIAKMVLDSLNGVAYNLCIVIVGLIVKKKYAEIPRVALRLEVI